MLADHSIDLKRIVVAGRSQDFDPRIAQTGLGVFEPRDEPSGHHLLEQCVSGNSIVRVVAVLVGRHPPRVQALSGAIGFEPLEFLGSEGLLLSKELGPISPALLHDRDDKFAREVTPEDQNVSSVERRSRNELAEAHLPSRANPSRRRRLFRSRSAGV